MMMGGGGGRKKSLPSPLLLWKNADITWTKAPDVMAAVVVVVVVAVVVVAVVVVVTVPMQGQACLQPRPQDASSTTQDFPRPDRASFSESF